MFGRKRRSGETQGETDFEDEPDEGLEDENASNAVTSDAAASPARPAGIGPWDATELPDDGVGRVDLGGLLVPVLEGLELRIDVDQASGALVSATLASQNSLMQVLAFAAPRTSGIWAEVRTEIVESIRTGGGRADVVEGAFGPEIVADVPTDTPGTSTPSRFLGVDGPRWFLRALIQGQAAVTPSAEPLLLHAFGLIGVVRGDEAMTVREGIPLRLPKELLATAEGTGAPGAGESGSEAEARPTYTLPERGPLNTETR